MQKNLSFLKALNISNINLGCFNGKSWVANGETYSVTTPIDGSEISKITNGNLDDYENCVKQMKADWPIWAQLPAPKRGDIVKQISEALKEKKNELGQLVSYEMGKISSEGLGEIQETIDVCDFACGLSRAINGSVIPSERPDHFMMEQWNPLGIVGVITAFNFPNAVFGWNLALAMIGGNMTIWKPAPTTPIIAIATVSIIQEILEKNNLPKSIVTLCCGGPDIGERIAKDKRINLVSFTGSTKVGRIVQQHVNDRFGKCLLELGGNNSTIILEDANLELAIKASIFGAVGTCGQRCTSLRRLQIQEKVFDEVKAKLMKIYPTISIGDPLETNILCGPLHTQFQVDMYKNSLVEIQKQGGKILCGGNVINRPGFYVEPTLVEIDSQAEILQHELFVPILFIMKFKTLDEAIFNNNNVPQGLSSSLFTNDLRNQFKWTGPLGSDCGIVNVNIGTSGAEIGGAFGGEKETGGGRESGSDSWKQYMRRSTCTINYGNALPLAQGVKFDI